MKKYLILELPQQIYRGFHTIFFLSRRTSEFERYKPLGQAKTRQFDFGVPSHLFCFHWANYSFASVTIYIFDKSFASIFLNSKLGHLI